MSLQKLKSLAGPALTSGGLMWVAIYVVTIIFGLTANKLVGTTPGPQQAPLDRVYVLLLPLSFLSLDLGLLGVYACLDGRARKLGMASLVLTSIALIMGTVSLVLLITSSSYMSDPLGVLFSATNAVTTVLSAGLLGCAVLRTHMLARPLAWTMIIAAVVLVPILFTTPLPIGPDWATDTLGFLLCGIAYTIVGANFLVRRKAMSAATS